MDLYEALGLAPALGGTVVAIVGGGGKTASLFALGAAVVERGGRALLATTTHIRDPRLEIGRRFDRVIVDSRFAAPPPSSCDGVGGLVSSLCFPEAPSIAVLGGSLEEGSDGEVSRLCAVDPAWPLLLAPSFDLVAVEADGSRSLPVKAPASHEPALPEGPRLVLGLVGLDCLGKPMDEATVHRPELFASVTGCGKGERIRPEHLLALARSNSGLFKGCANGVRRALVLNKADLLEAGDAKAVFAFLASRRAADLVLLASLGGKGASANGQVLESSASAPCAAGRGCGR